MNNDRETGIKSWYDSFTKRIMKAVKSKDAEAEVERVLSKEKPEEAEDSFSESEGEERAQLEELIKEQKAEGASRGEVLAAIHTIAGNHYDAATVERLLNQYFRPTRSSEERLDELSGRLDAHDSKHAVHDKRHSAHDEAIEKLTKDVDELKKATGVSSGEEQTSDEDEEEGTEEMTDAGESEEQEIAEEEIEGNRDRAMRAKDSSYLVDSFQATVAGAEILSPGIRIPTYDAKLPKKRTYDAICRLRRRALVNFAATDDGASMVAELNGGRPAKLDRMSCGAIRSLFHSTVAMKKQANNGSTRSVNDSSQVTNQGTGVKGKIKTAADLNKYHAQFYKDLGGLRH